jgi:WD40 repeat protein/beta-lactamase regulating signal transducer with metallopeptidase domain
MNASLLQAALSFDIDRLFLYLAEVAAAACLLFATAEALSWALQNKSAALRHHVWAAAIVALLVVPFAKLVVPAQLTLGLWESGTTETTPTHVEALPQNSRGAVSGDALLADAPEQASIDSTMPERTESRPAHETFTQPNERPIANARASAPVSFRPARWFAGIWLAGALLTFVPYLKSAFAIHRLISRTRPVVSGPRRTVVRDLAAKLAVRRPLALCESKGTIVPVVVGWRRPTIILPASSADWPADRCRQVILHELAHVKRGDIAWALAARTACAIHWFNPLAWLAAGQLRREREAACDDVVLVMGEPADDYATSLLDIARASRGGARLLAAGAAMARSTNVRRRITAILDNCRSRQQPRGVTSWICFIGAIGLSLALAAVGTQRAADAQTRRSETAAVILPPAAPATATPARLVWQSDSPPFAHCSGVGYLAFSPDGRYVATCAPDQRISKPYFLWDASTGALIRRFQPKDATRGRPDSVAISPDGKLILGGWGGGYATVWEIETGRELFTKKIHGETVLNAAFMPDSAHIVTCGSDSTIAVTRIADQAPVASWSFARQEKMPNSSTLIGGDSPAAASIDVAGDGRILTAHQRANSTEFIIWKVGSQEAILKIERPNTGERGNDRVVQSAAFSIDGRRIITAGARRVPLTATQQTHGPTNIQVVELRTWDASSGQLIAELSDPNVHGFGFIDVSPDGRTLATYDYGGIHLWRIGENQPFLYLSGAYVRGYGKGCFSADGRRIAAGSGNTIRIWNIETGEVVAGGDPFLTRVSAVAWNPDGGKIALGRAGALEVWDLSSRRRQFAASMGETLGITSRLHDVSALALTPDGSRLLAGGTRDDAKTWQAGVLRTWNLATGQMENEAALGIESQGEIDGAVFAPDRRSAIVVFQGQPPALYDLVEQKILANVPELRSSRDFRAARFTPDGRFIHILNRYGKSFRWNTANGTSDGEFVTEWRTEQERSGRETPPFVEHAAYSPNVRYLVTSHRPSYQPSAPSALVIWDNELGLPMHVIRGQRVCKLVVSPDSRLVAGFEINIGISGQEPTDTIHIWDLATGQKLFTLQPNDALATAMAFSPDGKQLLTGFDRGTFAIWDVR